MRRSALLVVLCACPSTSAVAPVPGPVAPVAAPVAAPPAVAPAPASRCVGGPASRVELLPSEATAVVAVDLASLTASELYRDNQAALHQGETKQFVDAAISCNLGPERWRRATLGFRSTANEFAVVVTAEGLAQNLACVRDALARQDGAKPWLRVEGSKHERYDFADGSAGWVLDECTFVVASQTWVTPVEQLLDGGGKSVLGTPLEPVIRRAVVGRPIWFAGFLPPLLVSGVAVDREVEASGSIDLSAGIAVSTALGFADPGFASTKAATFRDSFASARAGLTAIGIPQSVLDRVKIVAHGPTVAIDASANHEELATITAALRKL